MSIFIIRLLLLPVRVLTWLATAILFFGGGIIMILCIAFGALLGYSDHTDLIVDKFQDIFMWPLEKMDTIDGNLTKRS
jgi:fatty acid desaturase